MTPAAKYFATLGASRALYLRLFEDALGMLPPTPTGALERLASRAPQAQLARKLGISVSTLRTDLARLENWGWVERGTRLLGHREGARYYLLADERAQAHTGEAALVSREVLQIGRPEPSVAPPSAARERGPGAERGAGRKWRG